MIITIDGPVGTGKSTIAKQLAEKLRFVHFDTGAMYRCVAYSVLKHGIDPANESELKNLLEDFHFDIQIMNGVQHYFLDGEDITKEIRGQEVTERVSEISAIKSVREKLVELQRQLGRGKDAVFEGRDMGSVVFPEAELKFFLTAEPEVRARRRYEELKQKFPEESESLDFNALLASINERDRYDSTREISPLVKPDDAHIVDTSNLTPEEVLDKLIAIKNAMKDVP